ncbi:unnamed protein product [Closterium sp. NIES-64]|nr:unnamed protein product [Closterium sp. NIES-64]
MASPPVLAFDAEDRPVKFDTWLDDLHLFLQLTAKEDISLYDHALGHATAPGATADSTARSQWQTRDAHARFAIRNSLPIDEREHFGQHKTAQALYSAVVARCSSPASAALGRLSRPYLFPDLASFHTVADLITHLRTSEARFCAAMPDEFLAKNPPPLWLTLHHLVTRLPDTLRSVPLAVTPVPRSLRGVLPPPFFPLSPLLLLSTSLVLRRSGLRLLRVGAAAARAKGARAVVVTAGMAVVGEVVVAGGVARVGEVAAVGGVAAAAGEVAGAEEVVGVAVDEAAAGVGVVEEVVAAVVVVEALAVARASSTLRRPRRSATELPRWVDLLKKGIDIYDLDFDAILTAMYVMSTSGEGAEYLSVPPDPGIRTSVSATSGTYVSPALGAGEAAALGACTSCPPSTVSTTALHTFTLDSGASRCFFRDRTALKALARPVAVSLADPSGGPVVATSSTVLPCPAVPSGTLSGQLSAPCSCRSLAHETVLWHHRLGHPSVQRLRAMHSQYLVSGLPRVLPPLPPSPAPPSLTCVEGRQRAAPHSSSFPPTTAPLQTLHMDVWGPARVRGQGQERYFLIVVDDYSRYTTVFPLRTKGEVPDVLIPWIRRARLQFSERFRSDFPVLRLHSDRGGEFSSDLLAAYCAEDGIEQSFTLPASPQQIGVAERRIGLVMEVARTSLIHAAAPHFLWPFAVQYAAHQLNLWPRVSLPETSPTLLWTGEVGDASRFRVWGSRAFVRDLSADKLSSRAVPCVFLGFVPDAPGWQFYHATSHRVLPSQDVTFDESVPYYRLFPYRTAPLPPPPLFLAPGAAVVDPLPPQGAAPSGVSQVDPVEPVEVAVDSRPAGGAEPGGAEDGGAEPGGAETGGAEPGGADSWGAEPGGADSGGAEPGGADTEGTEPGGAEPGGAVTGGAEPGGAGSGGSDSGSAGPEGATPGRDLSSEQSCEWYLQYCSLRRGTSGTRRTTRTGAGTSPPSRELPSRERIREWYERRCTLRSGAPRLTDPAAAGAEDPGVGAAAGAVDPGVGAVAGAADPGVGAAAGAADPGVGGATGAEDPGVGAAAGAVDPGVGATAGAEDSGVGAKAGTEDLGVGAAGGSGTAARGTGAVPAVSGVAARPQPYFVPLLQQVLGLSPPPGPPPLACSQPVPSQLQLQPASPLPAPSPYTGPTGGLTERRESASRPASPVRPASASARSSRQRPPPAPGTHRMSLRPSTAPLRAPLPSPPASSLPALADPESDSLRAASPTVTRLLATAVTDPSFESSAASALVTKLVNFAARCRLDYTASLVAESESVCPPSVGGECALGTDVLEDRQEEFQCLAAASPHLVSVLLTPEGDPDALDIPTPRSYAEAIEGPYSSQWQAAMDAEMASWKSTGTYVDAVPLPGANIVSGMWIFRVKRLPGSPPVFKARYVARGFSQRQGVDYFQTFSPTPKMTTLRVLLHVAAHRDYELHSLDFSTAFLQGSLHEEIWLRRPPGFTGSFPPGTQWSLRRPVYGLRQAPREWHDTLRTTLAALGFAPSTADPSLFLRTDTSLLPFYILVYVDDLVFATADTTGLAYVKSELQKRHTCTDLGELRSYLGLQITRDRARRTITLTQSQSVQQVFQRFGFTYSSPQATPLSTRHSLSALPCSTVEGEDAQRAAAAGAATPGMAAAVGAAPGAAAAGAAAPGAAAAVAAAPGAAA